MAQSFITSGDNMLLASAILMTSALTFSIGLVAQLSTFLALVVRGSPAKFGTTNVWATSILWSLFYYVVNL